MAKNIVATTNRAKNIVEESYLLMEDGGFLLQEDGSKIVLSRATSNRAKNIVSLTNR